MSRTTDKAVAILFGILKNKYTKEEGAVLLAEMEEDLMKEAIENFRLFSPKNRLYIFNNFCLRCGYGKSECQCQGGQET